MALVNHAKKEINAKIVYCGPAGSGKGTSLSFIYKRLKPEFRGQFRKTPLRRNNLLLFDFLPPGTETINGYHVRFHVYTVSGPDIEPAMWKVTLKGADGIILVADPVHGTAETNIAAMTLVRESLQEHGMSVEDIPFALQMNKKDLLGTSFEDLAAMLSPGHVPVFPTSAATGEGLLGGLSSVIRQVVQQLRETPVEQMPPVSRRELESMSGLTSDAEFASPTDGISPVGEPEVVAEHSDDDRDTVVPVEGMMETFSQVQSQRKAFPVELSLGESVLDDDGVLKVPVFVAVNGEVSEFTLSVTLTRCLTE